MDDLIEQYVAIVRKRLSRQESDVVVRTAEALCLPSFHPEALLQATQGPRGAAFRFTTFTASLWYAGQAVGSGKTPGRVQEVAVVQPEIASRFWDAVDALKPHTIQTSRAIGVDGMAVHVTYQDGEAESCFETWSPDSASSGGRFVHLIYDLAWEVLKERVSIERLEQLFGYLRPDLPARLIPGDVQSLRLFGSLASYHQQELVRLFDRLPGEDPLVIDMTNFDGMGTLLYPTFVRFAAARRLLAWACSQNARRHVESMRVPKSQVFDDTASAIEWVKRASR
jgi:hypothetical protein